MIEEDWQLPMTKNHTRFFDLLATVPFLGAYWDSEKLIFDEWEFNDAAAYWSPGQLIMGRFFASVWVGGWNTRFDIFEAVSCLDESNLKIIKQWVNDPFWP